MSDVTSAGAGAVAIDKSTSNDLSILQYSIVSTLPAQAHEPTVRIASTWRVLVGLKDRIVPKARSTIALHLHVLAAPPLSY